MNQYKLPISEIKKTLIPENLPNLSQMNHKERELAITTIATKIKHTGISNQQFRETSRFFRIRKWSDSEVLESDLWAPPKDKTTAGRCNLPEQPVLYLSTDAKTPFLELNAKSTDKFLLIEYRAKKTFTIQGIASKSSTLLKLEDFLQNQEEIDIYDELVDYIRSIFMRPVTTDKATDINYKISESICRNWMSLADCYGWSYPPINGNSTMENVAIKEKFQKELLYVNDSWLVQLKPLEGNKELKGMNKTTTMCAKNTPNVLCAFPNNRPTISIDNKIFVPTIIN
ncbi:MAG: hypothetical protein OCC45_08140 [Desulfotalea sp.]